MIERIKLRRSVMRANLLATSAVIIALLVIGVVGVLALTGAFSDDDDGPPASTEAVVEQVTPSTVLMLTPSGDSGEFNGNGTGWVYDAEEGLIVTNNHVISGYDKYKVGFNEEQRDARVLESAPCEDAALVKVENTEGMKTVALADQKALRLGAPAIALGYPSNAAEEDQLTAAAGVVSNPMTKYSPKQGGFDVPDLPNVVQTDAAINPGNSGGPLVNIQSQLIGMNTAGLPISEFGRPLQNSNYAVGVDRIKEVVADFKQGKSRGYIGAGLEPATPEDLARIGAPPGTRGMLLIEAQPGSPADEIGLGDGKLRVLTAVNGNDLDGGLRSYCQAIAGVESGETATFTILSAAGTQDVEIKLT